MNCLVRRTIILLLCLFTAMPHAQEHTPPLVELGRALFFDEKLSATGKVNCATCHQPDRAFTDGRRVSLGIDGAAATRNAPSLIGAADQKSFFWDGRRTTLEAQVLDPFINPVEHGLKSHEQLLTLLLTNEDTAVKMRQAFPAKREPIDLESVQLALVAFVRSLKADRSALDRYLYAGEAQALSYNAVNGLKLFRGRAGCASCHVIGKTEAALTDGSFHAAGVGLDRIVAKLPALTTRIKTGNAQAIDHAIVNDAELAELGRFLVTGDPKDIGKFKTPSLRNVSRTAPYMHDGSVATLKDAVERELYYRGLQSGQPIALTPQEKADLLELLQAM